MILVLQQSKANISLKIDLSEDDSGIDWENNIYWQTSDDQGKIIIQSWQYNY